MIIRSKVVLPVPFRPTRPTRASGRRWADASEKSVFVGYCLVKDSMWIIVQSGIPNIGLSFKTGRGIRKSEAGSDHYE